MGGGRRLLWLHVALLPTLAIVLFATTGRPAIPLAFDGGTLTRTPADGREAQLYTWLRAATPADAVVIQDPLREGRECTGNTSELPAFTGRALFTDYAAHYLVAPNRDAARRVALCGSLARGEPLGDADRGYLAALRRPLFFVSWDADDATQARLRTLHGVPRFALSGVQVYELKVAP